MINDDDVTLDSAVLYSIDYEWGGMGTDESVEVRITDLKPGSHALIWRDDGSGAEVRMELSILVAAREMPVPLQFAFPKLYRMENFPVVEELGRPGWAVVGKLDGG